MGETLSKNESNPKQAIIPIVNLFPGMDPKLLDTISKDANAIILVVFGTGGSGGNLNEEIKKLTENNIPVFLVAEKDGNDFGITRKIDQTQIESEKSSAIRIEKLNYKNMKDITDMIQKEFNEGKKGKELGLAIKEHFSYKENEPKPIPDWENPLKRKN